jgi:ribulose-phosphate 3-epimerase
MKKKDIKVAPSLLAGDFGKIAEEAKRVEQSGADILHLDVMDGQFVPNLTIGPQIVAAVNRATSLFLEVHLMIYNPYEFVERFVEAGADRIIFHFEATENIEEVIEYIHRCNVQAGLAFCPDTTVEFAPKFLSKCDLILLMTVHPGFGGQAFIPEILEKIEYVRQECTRQNIVEGGKMIAGDNQADLAPFPIEVDGGINEETAWKCVHAGANVLVAGTYLFKEIEMAVGIEKLRACGE